jgi:putative hemolysin
LEPALWAELGGIGLCLLVASMAVAGQAALHYLNRARLRSLSEQGGERAEAVLRALEHPSTSFGTLHAIHALALVIGAVLTLLTDLALASSGLAAPIMLSVVLLLLALVLPLIARVIAIAQPESTAMRLYAPLALVSTILTPLVLPLRALERTLLGMAGLTRSNDPHWAEEELRLLVESSEERGVLEEDEREMIHGIFLLSEVTAREVMVPRIDIVGLPADALVSQVVTTIVDSGHSRIPIYDGSIDNIVGLAYAKDVLKHLTSGSMEDPVRPLARAAHFVPEAKKLDELLDELMERRVHMAIVVDEYGGTAGLLTIEDLLEEIVGEIRDEYDQAEEARVEQLSEHEAIIDARTSIREVNDLLDLHLPDDEFDTLGGLVYDRLGKVPAADDQVRVDGCLIQVLSTEGRRVKKVRLLVGQPDESEPA